MDKIKIDHLISKTEKIKTESITRFLENFRTEIYKLIDQLIENENLKNDLEELKEDEDLYD